MLLLLPLCTRPPLRQAISASEFIRVMSFERAGKIVATRAGNERSGTFSLIVGTSGQNWSSAFHVQARVVVVVVVIVAEVGIDTCSVLAGVEFSLCSKYE